MTTPTGEGGGTGGPPPADDDRPLTGTTDPGDDAEAPPLSATAERAVTAARAAAEQAATVARAAAARALAARSGSVDPPASSPTTATTAPSASPPGPPSAEAGAEPPAPAEPALADEALADEALADEALADWPEGDEALAADEDDLAFSDPMLLEDAPPAESDSAVEDALEAEAAAATIAAPAVEPEREPTPAEPAAVASGGTRSPAPAPASTSPASAAAPRKAPATSVPGREAPRWLAMAGLIVGIWGALPHFVTPPLDTENLVEIVDHVVPGALVFAVCLGAVLLQRRNRPAGGYLFVGGLALVLAGLWMVATHLPLLAQAARDEAPWAGTIYHSASALSVLGFSLIWMAANWNAPDFER